MHPLSFWPPRLGLFAVLYALSVLTSCRDKHEEPLPQASLTVRFEGRVFEQALALESRTYDAPSAVEGFRFVRLSFFLSDLELLPADATSSRSVPLAEVAYVELGPGGTTELRIDSLPPGDYDSLSLRFGLTAAQDARQPKDYPAESPLARSEEYWVDWGSYVFLKLEGRADTLADGLAVFQTPFVYHLGRSGDNGVTIQLPIGLTLEAGQNRVLPLGVDAGALLALRGSEPLPVSGAIDHRNEFAQRIMAQVPTAFYELR